MTKYRSSFEYETCYHIFNRAVGDEKMFRHQENYHFFLEKFKTYMLSVVDAYGYCLLPNHFHFFIKTKTEKEILKYHDSIKAINNKATVQFDVHKFIMQQFSNCFNSYTKAYNKVYDRKGKLFMDNLNRRMINTETYYSKLVHYIHFNPVKHGYCKKPSEWNFSSFALLTNKNETWLCKEDVMKWFGGYNAFIKFHEI